MSENAEKLAEAFRARDEIEGFLANLVRLKADSAISEELYTATREDYNRRLDAAASDLARIKSELKQELDNSQQEIETVHRIELGKLDVKYKVGELSQEEYQASDKKLRTRIKELEQYCKELTRLIEANSVADIDVIAEKPEAAPPEPLPVSEPEPPAEVAPEPQEIAQPEQPAYEAEIPAGADTEIKKTEPGPPGPSLASKVASAIKNLLTPWTKILAIVGGILLLVSVFMPWIASVESFRTEFGSQSGASISGILWVVGIICGLIVIGTAFLPAPGVRGTVLIIIGVIALFALPAVIITGILPLLRGHGGMEFVIREGIYVWLIAVVMLFIAGPIELKNRFKFP